jgi:hypothetical protein
MALVSDRSLADLCLELNQPSSSSLPLSLSSSSTTSSEGEVLQNEEIIQNNNQENNIERTSGSSSESSQSSSICPSNSLLNGEEQEKDQAPSLNDPDPESRNIENGFEDNEEEQEEGNGIYLSLAEFRKQSEELTSYLENFKAMKLERELQEEVAQNQSYQDEKIAAFTELDNMVSFINNVKTTFTPPEKEKPVKKDTNVTNGKKLSTRSTTSPLVGKGKYASKGKLIHQNSDDPDSTLTTVSTSQYSPRGQNEDDSLMSENEMIGEVIHSSNQKKSSQCSFYHSEDEEEQEEYDGQHSERTSHSSSDESEVSLLLPCPDHFPSPPSVRLNHTHTRNHLPVLALIRM